MPVDVVVYAELMRWMKMMVCIKYMMKKKKKNLMLTERPGPAPEMIHTGSIHTWSVIITRIGPRRRILRARAQSKRAKGYQM